MTSSHLNAQAIVFGTQSSQSLVPLVTSLPGSQLIPTLESFAIVPQVILPTNSMSKLSSDDIRLALRLALGDLNVSLHRNTVKALARRILQHLQPAI